MCWLDGKLIGLGLGCFGWLVGVLVDGLLVYVVVRLVYACLGFALRCLLVSACLLY